MKTVNIYITTDMKGFKGNGSYKIMLECEGYTKEINRSVGNVTNRQIEIKALIEAVKSIKYTCLLKIHTESFYLNNAILGKTILCWKNREWKTTKHTDIKNKELWQELYLELSRHLW